jgi:hypothetical protein
MTTTSGRDGLSIGNELSDPDGLSLSHRLTFTAFHEPKVGDYLLLQTGDYLLLQNNGKIILEAA